jgi:hypothetical protein
MDSGSAGDLSALLEPGHCMKAYRSGQIEGASYVIRAFYAFWTGTVPSSLAIGTSVL